MLKRLAEAPGQAFLHGFGKRDEIVGRTGQNPWRFTPVTEVIQGEITRSGFS
jgi:hypothetical protein